MFKALISLLLLGCLLISTPLAAQEGMAWREVNPENLVLIGMREGEIVIELNPEFAPATVEKFKQLVRDDFYRGLSFYRVIDGFVAQAGDESDIDGGGSQTPLPAEFEKEFDREMNWAKVQDDDFYADQTGFIDGFPAAREGKAVWLTHCPGAVAMARGNEIDSGNTDFYIVLGQAPRYLDRNLTVFGRVIDGMEVAQKIRRGPTEENGIIENDIARSRIGRMRIASDLSEEDARMYYVMDTSSAGFAEMMESRRNRKHEFFHHKPPKVLDVCQVPVASRNEKLPKLSRQIDQP